MPLIKAMRLWIDIYGSSSFSVESQGDTGVLTWLDGTLPGEPGQFLPSGKLPFSIL